MDLFPKQSEALHYLEGDVVSELIYGGGAGGGKSQLGCYWITKSALKYAGTRWLMGRRELKTLRETTLNTFFEVCKMQGLISGKHYNFNQQQMCIHFVNGSEILLKDLATYPSDPEFDSLGSLEITGAFVDECGQISEKAWNIVKSRIRYKLDIHGLIPTILGTCNPTKGYVYNNFYKPYKENKLPTSKRFIQALLDDNPYISRHYKENLLQLDSTSKERLLFGNWEYDDDPATLIPYDSILDIFTATEVYLSGKKFITADIARFGSDKSVIMVWSGWSCIEIVTLEKKAITEVADAIQRLKNKHGIPTSQIVCDEDGVGGGVVDILRCKGFVNGSSPIDVDKKKQNYSNLKSQCYFELAQKINAGEVFVKTDNIEIKKLLTEELEWVKRKDIDKDGKLSVLPKDVIKEKLGRSPDYSDTLMMRVFFDLKPKIKPINKQRIADLMR